MKNELDLGRLLGQREAFNVVAGRCSAADATILREMREKKLYEGYAENWEEFCSTHLHISKTNANRIIRNLEEFGPAYFEVAQLTRISPETYRAIAPSIRDQALHHDGNAIALIPENAEKVAAAVADLRKSAAPPPSPPEQPVERLEQRFLALVKEVEEVVESREWPLEIRSLVCSLRTKMDRIEQTI